MRSGAKLIIKNQFLHMKVVELLKISKNFLETLHNACIKMKDVRFVSMYEEYTKMVDEKHKITYISAVLSKKYGISERQFFYLIKRLGQDCTIGAAG